MTIQTTKPAKFSRTVVFNHSDFRRSHGRHAAGRGSWAFKVPEWNRDTVIWSPAGMTLTECKAFIAETVKAPAGWTIEAFPQP